MTERRFYPGARGTLVFIVLVASIYLIACGVLDALPGPERRGLMLILHACVAICAAYLVVKTVNGRS